jgi:hypothetical protein
MPDQKLPRWLRWFLGKAPEWLKPSLTLETRPPDSRYVKSFMVMRTGSGLLGFALPLLLVGIGKAWDYDDRPWFRGSLSEYYYSGARDWFIGVLSATAAFLLVYKVVEPSLENILSIAAAVAVIFVVGFPTGTPSYFKELTPLQEWNESFVQEVHYTAAGLFIGSLGAITFLFGVREARRRTQQGRFSQTFWRRWHFGCAIAIAAAGAWIIANKITAKYAGWDIWKPVIVGEWVAVWAFAASWFYKGLDIDYLRGESTAPA